MTDKKTLADYALNPDGKTYNAAGLAQFLFKATTGKEMSADEAAKVVADGQALAVLRKAKAMSASGQDQNGLGVKPASAVGEADLP